MDKKWVVCTYDINGKWYAMQAFEHKPLLFNNFGEALEYARENGAEDIVSIEEYNPEEWE